MFTRFHTNFIYRKFKKYFELWPRDDAPPYQFQPNAQTNVEKTPRSLVFYYLLPLAVEIQNFLRVFYLVPTVCDFLEIIEILRNINHIKFSYLYLYEKGVI